MSPQEEIQRLRDQIDPDSARHWDTMREERDQARRALVDLAQAASLVVAQWDLDFVSVSGGPMTEDIKRLRSCLVEHMPVIEGASPAPDDDRHAGLKEAILFLLEKSAECEASLKTGAHAAVFGVSGMVALRLAALDLAKQIGDRELVEKIEEMGR